MSCRGIAVVLCKGLSGVQEGKKERADMVMVTGGNQEQSQEENQEATLV